MSEMHDGRENMQYLSDAMTDAEFVAWASTQYSFEERERNRLAALAREGVRAQEETP